jgi:hypothetical protein
VQVSFGRELVEGKLPADKPEVIARYLNLSRQHKIPIDGTCVDRLHVNGLKSDPLGPKWVLDSIRLTKALNTKVLLLPFFGRWPLESTGEMERLGGRSTRSGTGSYQSRSHFGSRGHDLC